MNKKVLTLCAAMLLYGSSLVSVYAESVPIKDWNPETVVKGTNSATLTGDVMFGEQKNYVLIDQDNYVLDGAGHTLTGHLVVTGSHVTIKNLTIDYKNTFSESEDGTLTVNKTAISVFSDNVTIDNCVINCSTDHWLSNAITVFPTSEDANIVLTNNTINNANQSVGGDLASGIQIVEGYSYDYTGLDDAQKPEGTSKVMTNFDALAVMENNEIKNATTDISYIDYSENDAVTKAIQVEPQVVNGKLTNQDAIESLVSASEGAIVRFKGTSEELLDALKDANLKTSNVAVQCLENETNVLFGNAENPENGWLPESVTVNDDGDVARIQSTDWGTYADYKTDGKTSKVVLVVNKLAIKAVDVEGKRVYTLGAYYPSATTDVLDPSLFQFTLAPREYAANQYELGLQDHSGKFFGLAEGFARVNGITVTKDKDGNFLYNGQNAADFVFPTELELKIGNKFVAWDNPSSTFITVSDASKAQKIGTAKIREAYLFAEDLLARFGEYFTLGITYTSKDEYNNDVKTDLTSIFEGELTPVLPVTYGQGVTRYDLAHPKATRFMLMNENNELLVLDTNPETAWSAGNDIHAYQLKKVSTKAYEIDQKNDKYYQAYFSFEYTPGDDVTTLTKITNIYVDNHKVGCYLDNKKVPYLAGQGEIGTLLTVDFILNPSAVVNAQSWLTTPSYYIVEVANVNKKAQYYGKVLGQTEKGYIDFVAPTKTDINMPEGQFAIKYENGNYTLTNRENHQTYTLRGSDLYKTSTENVFAYRNNVYNLMDTLKITPVTKFSSEDGFRRIPVADLNANTYSVALNTIAGPLYVIENHNDKHRIGLDEESATAWRIEQPTVKVLDVTGDFDHYAADTVSIYTPITYWADNGWRTTQNYNPKGKYYVPNAELLIPTYILKNTATDEYFNGKDGSEEAGNAYYVCNEDEKTATRLALKLVGNSTISLIPVYNYSQVASYKEGNYSHIMYKDWVAGAEVYESDYKNYSSESNMLLSEYKVIGGTTADKGVLKDVTRYEATSNDLFVLEDTGARTYKLLNQDDKIAISLMENNDEVIYEDGDFANIDNRLAYEGLNPTLYVDTAYINRLGNYRYEYLLSVRPLRVDSIESCNNPNHEHPRTTFTEGDFLVVMRDSMEAYKDKDVHNNIYAYNEQPRLAFVSAKHQNDTLYYTDAAGKVIDKVEVGNAKYNFAKFAFKMIDEANNEFVIETAYGYTPTKIVNDEIVEYEITKGYLRWDNSFLVVTPNLDDAEHFTMEASELAPTANEEISAEEATVSVVATNGAVIVKGAEGKNVVVSTILGKVVANEVLNSDNETIAAPAGIVVVSVDGESFKVAVK